MLTKAMQCVDAILCILFVLGFIAYVFAVMHYAIEQDATRAILATCAAVVYAMKI